MSNPADGLPETGLPVTVPDGTGTDKDTVDQALNTVEHQISLFWRRARSVSYQLSRQVHPDMEPAAYGLLAVIRREGPIRLTDLAMNIGVGKPSVSRQIAFLESIGLVFKEADPLDGRAQSIRLTEKGEEKMHQVQDARRQDFRERLGEWPVEELQTLAEYMAKLNSIFELDGLPKDSSGQGEPTK
ncbi:MAG TPA: MarR family transcriptional regulator [Arthrobacter bacterium]|jgi:DNA-binding MarR family transcriptional regulator|nr:MarR family transcriptional regulator [Arthrobacter sp.]HAP88546.1 MarR family transcriptional regulator [Arthrobacter sp.]HBH59842.1 MarR family transcriptional regulator [Arthrobacter sp.]HCB56730.1 MarR family transcriptional regulator [Arthrobacter sp.]HCC39246.1 MarR family transcriptional regulator [Arthrobacter sp.]